MASFARDFREMRRLMEDALRARYFLYPYAWDMGAKALVPNYIAIRSFSRCLAVQARFYTDARDAASAVECYQTGERLGARFAPGGPVIHGMIGLAVAQVCQRPHLANIPRLASRLTPAARARLQQQAAIPLVRPSLVDVVTCEYYFGRTVLQQVAGGEKILDMPDLEGVPPPSAAEFNAHMRYFSAILGLLRQPAGRRTRNFVAAAQDEWRQRFKDARQQFSLILMPDLVKALGACDVNDLVSEGIAAVSSLYVYRADHGRFPSSLQALVPRYLPRIPTDPRTSSPLEYRLQGASFTLRGRGTGTGAPVQASAAGVGERGIVILHPAQ